MACRRSALEDPDRRAERLVTRNRPGLCTALRSAIVPTDSRSVGQVAMKLNGEDWRSIYQMADGWRVGIIDQTVLPFAFRTAVLETPEEAARAIAEMQVRGAPLIGVTAAYGIALAMRADPSDEALEAACSLLAAARPTAVNLRWAIERARAVLISLEPQARCVAAYELAARMADDDVAVNRRIGRHGLELIRQVAAEKTGPVNILTHCNAGWLATVDVGTATAPIYLAHDEGIEVHVWVDETRPRNQGGLLTAWELGGHGVPNTVVADNAGGHLMQRGHVDLCLVGTDRTTRTGDVCNKIGTYLKALAARDNGVPFYVCLPSSTIDWNIEDGVADIPIEERDAEEVTHILGADDSGTARRSRVVAPGVKAANPAFDVTPARLVTGLITEHGVAEASEAGLRRLFPEAGGGNADSRLDPRLR